ncbi:MAG: hypothetical protein ACK41Y_16380, partial [Paracoccus hibiscisoli]|uniref:hypothetical protein n=1 Tax=Paracoccus hibiscisoli TaxID=2023261 RepID=UPI00391D737D
QGMEAIVTSTTDQEALNDSVRLLTLLLKLVSKLSQAGLVVDARKGAMPRAARAARWLCADSCFGRR